MSIILESTEEAQDREELRRMFTTEAPEVEVTPDSDEWVPPWWGTDEENSKEAAAFSEWTRKMRPVE